MEKQHTKITLKEIIVIVLSWLLALFILYMVYLKIKLLQ